MKADRSLCLYQYLAVKNTGYLKVSRPVSFKKVIGREPRWCRALYLHDRLSFFWWSVVAPSDNQDRDEHQSFFRLQDFTVDLCFSIWPVEQNNSCLQFHHCRLRYLGFFNLTDILLWRRRGMYFKNNRSFIRSDEALVFTSNNKKRWFDHSIAFERIIATVEIFNGGFEAGIAVLSIEAVHEDRHPPAIVKGDNGVDLVSHWCHEMPYEYKSVYEDRIWCPCYSCSSWTRFHAYSNVIGFRKQYYQIAQLCCLKLSREISAHPGRQ